jgi:hypothetical protein
VQCGHMGPRQIIDVETFRSTWKNGDWQEPNASTGADSAA